LPRTLHRYADRQHPTLTHQWSNAMPSTRALLVLATLLVLDTALHGRGGPSATTPQPAPLPQMADWFLSTGDWQNDPQLYVREFGRGSERVVMLHGGWGAEHNG
jgi:hypothetical protein